jgi:hypothetical protein
VTVLILADPATPAGTSSSVIAKINANCQQATAGTKPWPPTTAAATWSYVAVVPPPPPPHHCWNAPHHWRLGLAGL